MALTISQIIAASFPAVVNEARKPANQWLEASFLREAERQGMIEKVSGAPTIEKTLDYRRNPGGDFLATDMTPVTTSKTDILTAASYTPAQLSIPIVWSKADDAQNPSENQKVALVKSLLENALNSHDDMIEEAVFGTSTDGFLGLKTIVPDSGQGTVGGIDSSVETWWRNYSSTYTIAGFANGVSAMTTAWNTATKGSGSSMSPTLIASDAATQALYEASQQGLQRYVDTDELKAGFKILAFKTARYVFSPYANTRIYFLNPKSFKITVFKNMFRQLGDTIEIPNQEGFIRKVSTMLQSSTNNKSRLALLTGV